LKPRQFYELVSQEFEIEQKSFKEPLNKGGLDCI
jgi:hypothetical protein